MKMFRILLGIMLTTLLMTIAGFPQEIKKSDFLTEAIDSGVNPGVDFFKFATGSWMKNNPIPASERSWGIGNLVQEETYQRLKGILQDAEVANSPQGSNEQKIGDFYFSGMDSENIERDGITPLGSELDKINSIKSKKDLFNVVALLQSEGVNVMFGLFVDQDQMKSDVYALYLWQGGLGLPNREYYFRKDARTENIRNEYKKHVAKIFELLGENSDESVTNANTVYQVELFLADSSRKLEDLRDPYANYNKMAISHLNIEAPSIDWEDLCTGKCEPSGFCHRWPARILQRIECGRR